MFEFGFRSTDLLRNMAGSQVTQLLRMLNMLKLAALAAALINVYDFRFPTNVKQPSSVLTPQLQVGSCRRWAERSGTTSAHRNKPQRRDAA